VCSYPGLASAKGHAIAARQMQGFGGVLSFTPRGDQDAVRRVLEGLRLVHLAAHLGGVNTIPGPPALTSHLELTAAERERAGIPENLIRYSVGIENVEDLQADLASALERV
jgi:cystathionine gamma-synthase